MSPICVLCLSVEDIKRCQFVCVVKLHPVSHWERSTCSDIYTNSGSWRWSNATVVSGFESNNVHGFIQQEEICIHSLFWKRTEHATMHNVQIFARASYFEHHDHHRMCWLCLCIPLYVHLRDDKIWICCWIKLFIRLWIKLCCCINSKWKFLQLTTSMCLKCHFLCQCSGKSIPYSFILLRKVLSIHLTGENMIYIYYIFVAIWFMPCITKIRLFCESLLPIAVNIWSCRYKSYVMDCNLGDELIIICLKLI